MKLRSSQSVARTLLTIFSIGLLALLSIGNPATSQAKPQANDEHGLTVSQKTARKIANKQSKKARKIYKSANSGETAVEDVVQTKTFNWTDLRYGDCIQTRSTLVIRSDGSASFECVTYTRSTHSGDYWWTSFRLLDKDDVIQVTEGRHRGPRMSDGNPSPRYRWNFDFRFEASKFAAITKAIQFYSC